LGDPDSPAKLRNGLANVLCIVRGTAARTDDQPVAGVPLGGVVTYTITLSNTGNGAAEGVVLTDALPIEVDFGGWVLQPAGAVQAGDTVTWTGSVAAGAEITLIFTATVGTDPAYYDRTVLNTAAFSSSNARSGSDDAALTLGSQARYRVYLPLVARHH
jgi:uncharacterized repeat protein (TIGR01451 family)